MGVAPSWSCHALVCLAPNSWDQELSADVSFVTVLATVLSEYWKKLEEIFFWNDITLRRLWKLYHFEKYSQAFFNILTEPLPVQKLTIHQQKAHFMNWILYVTFLIFVSGQSHENQALSHGETANHNSTIKLQENFVSNDIREDNETVIESTIDEEISSSSVATRSMFPFIF